MIAQHRLHYFFTGHMLTFRPGYKNNSYKRPLPETDTYVWWAWVDRAGLDRPTILESIKNSLNLVDGVWGLEGHKAQIMVYAIFICIYVLVTCLSWFATIFGKLWFCLNDINKYPTCFTVWASLCVFKSCSPYICILGQNGKDVSYFPFVDCAQLRVLKLVAGENLPEGLKVNNEILIYYLDNNLVFTYKFNFWHTVLEYINFKFIFHSINLQINRKIVLSEPNSKSVLISVVYTCAKWAQLPN